MNKKNLTLMNEFNLAVANSVQDKKGLVNIGNYKFYYSKEYGANIKEFLKDVDSKESGKESLRSASSSARLCTNYYYGSGVVFEKPIHNDVSSTPTKMDAVNDMTFIECKCQEIVEGEHELLRKSYQLKKSSKLFKEFNITNLKIKHHFNSKNVNDYDYCDFFLKDLGIDYPGKYYDINFNVKQLICHLIAIANEFEDATPKTLKYVIFRPSDSIISQSIRLGQLYKELDNQFAAICASEKIKSFISSEHHNITIEMEYVPVDKISEHFN